MANPKRTEVTGPLSRRSWGETRDKTTNFCVEARSKGGTEVNFLEKNRKLTRAFLGKQISFQEKLSGVHYWKSVALLLNKLKILF